MKNSTVNTILLIVISILLGIGIWKFGIKKETGPLLQTSCVVGGCNSNLCYDPKTESGNSICIVLPEYSCYKTTNTTCKRQETGKCGWTETSQLQQCLDSYKKPNEPVKPVIKENPKKIALKKIIVVSDGTSIPIQECKVGNTTYFQALFSVVDGPNLLYDVNGNLTVSCGGGMHITTDAPPLPPICSQLTQCVTVYGNGGAGMIDVYHVN